MTATLPIYEPDTAQETLLRRQPWDAFDVPDALLDANERIFGERIGPDEAVGRILADVRARGDAALRAWTRIDPAVGVGYLPLDEHGIAILDAQPGKPVQVRRLTSPRAH